MKKIGIFFTDMSEKCGISRDTGNFAAAAEKRVRKKDNS